MSTEPRERGQSLDELLEQIAEDERADILERVRDLASNADA